MDELVWTMQQWRWLRHGSNVFQEKAIDYLDRRNWIESPKLAKYSMNKFRPVNGQRYPDTRELINGYADDYWVRNPTPETIKQLWTQGQPPTVLSQYLVDGTYFYLYVKTDYNGTVTMFKSVPNELVQQMEALLDSMPEITRKWNGISQHTFSLNGAEPRLNTPPGSESESESQGYDSDEALDLHLMAATPEGAALTMSGGNPSPLKVLLPQQQHTSPYTSESESDGSRSSFYDIDDGPPPLQSESESDEEEDRDNWYSNGDGDNSRMFYLPEVEEIDQVQYTKNAQTTAKRSFTIYKLDPGRQVTDVPECLDYTSESESEATQLGVQQMNRPWHTSLEEGLHDPLTWSDVLSSSESEEELLRVPSRKHGFLYTDAWASIYHGPNTEYICTEPDMELESEEDGYDWATEGSPARAYLQEEYDPSDVAMRESEVGLTNGQAMKMLINSIDIEDCYGGKAMYRHLCKLAGVNVADEHCWSSTSVDSPSVPTSDSDVSQCL